MKLSIGKKLGLAFAVILFLLAVSIVVTLLSSKRVLDTSDRIATIQYPSMKALDQMAIQLFKKRTIYDQYFLTKRASDKRKIEQIEKEFEKYFKQAAELSPNMEVKDKLSPLLKKYNSIFETVIEYMDKYPDNLTGIMRKVAIADQYFNDELMPVINELSQQKSEATDNLVNDLQNNLKRSNNLTLIVGIIAIVLGIILASILSRGITKPVKELTAAVDEISVGKVDTEIEVKTHDEIHHLAVSIDRMRKSLKKAMERLQRK